MRLDLQGPQTLRWLHSLPGSRAKVTLALHSAPSSVQPRWDLKPRMVLSDCTPSTQRPPLALCSPSKFPLTTSVQHDITAVGETQSTAAVWQARHPQVCVLPPQSLLPPVCLAVLSSACPDAAADLSKATREFLNVSQGLWIQLSNIDPLQVTGQ